jgi:hypothetical protein
MELLSFKTVANVSRRAAGATESARQMQRLSEAAAREGQNVGAVGSTRSRKQQARAAAAAAKDVTCGHAACPRAQF